jgi:hypothetical protein
MMLLFIVIRLYSDSLYIITILDTFWYFTFFTPCITIQLLQFETTNATNFIKVTILQHISYCMFRSSLAYNQGGHSCTNSCLIFSACSRAAENSSVCNIYVVNRIGAACFFESYGIISLDLLRKYYIVRSFRQLCYWQKISSNCFCSSNEQIILMYNLKILVTLWSDMATARW